MAKKQKGRTRKPAAPQKRSARRPRDPAELSAREARFVSEYLIVGNGAEAARRAGYAEKSAKVTAARLLTKANLLAAIEEGQKKAAEKAEVNLDRLLRRLMLIAEADPRLIAKWGPGGVELLESVKLSKDEAAIIASVQQTQHGVGFKTHDPLAAITLLLKYLGVLKEKHEHTGPDGGPVQVDLSQCTDEELVLLRRIVGKTTAGATRAKK